MGRAEIIPIFKKGTWVTPANYRHISLIDNTQKHFAQVLLNRLLEWMTATRTLSPWQVGFRERISTQDQVLQFQFLYWKYVLLGWGQLNVVFVDLRSVFDLVFCSRLWQVMDDLGILHYLLNMIIKMWSDG